MIERRRLESPEWPVPDQGARLLEAGGDPLHGLRADVEDHHIVWNRGDRDDPQGRSRSERGGYGGVFGKDDTAVPLTCETTLTRSPAT